MSKDTCDVSPCPKAPTHVVTFDTSEDASYRYCGDHAWPFWKDYSRHTQRVVSVERLDFTYF